MATFYNKDGQEVQRTKCQVYTRVMGYLRPVSHYNHGKKSEFYSRKYFEENKAMNSEFMRDFGKSASEINANYNLLDGHKVVGVPQCACA